MSRFLFPALALLFLIGSMLAGGVIGFAIGGHPEARGDLLLASALLAPTLFSLSMVCVWHAEHAINEHRSYALRRRIGLI